MLIQLRASPTDINIIQVYASTAAANNDEKIEFYERLSSTVEKTRSYYSCLGLSNDSYY